jgi:phage-related protein
LKRAELTILTLAGLFIFVGLIFAGINDMANWLYNVAGPAISDFFGGIWDWLVNLAEGIYNFGGTATQAILDFLAYMAAGFLEAKANVIGAVTAAGAAVLNFFLGIGTHIFNFVRGIYQWFYDIFQAIVQALARFWVNARTSIQTGATNIIDFVKSIPGRIASYFNGNVLFNAGMAMINGLISGIKSAIPNLTSLLSWITNSLPSWKGPEDTDKKILKPAGMAVMEGFREGIAAGAAGLLGDLSALTGMISVSANPNTFIFGQGAIQQNFTGQPTPQAATSMGNATGSAIASTVNQQTMRGRMRAA